MATVATGNPFFGPALHAVIFLGFVWLFFHRDEPSPLDIHFHITQPGALWMGAFVGVFFLGFFQVPRFVTTRLFNSEGAFYPWFYLTIVSAIGVVAGVYNLQAGNFMLGWGLTPVFGILTAALIIAYLFNFASITDGLSQLKFLALIALVALSEAANAYPLTVDGLQSSQDIRPWNAVIWAAAFLVVFVVFYAVAVLAPLPHQERNWWVDGTEHTSKRIFVIAFFAAIALVFVPALIMDEVAFRQYGPPSETTPEEEEQKLWCVLAATGAGSLAILVILWIWWTSRGYKPIVLRSGPDAGAGIVYGPHKG